MSNKNTSLSARIRRRNKCGFSGLGTGKMVINGEVRSFNSVRASKMGDYTDPKQNHKDVDYKLARRRKDRFNMKSIVSPYGVPFTLHKRALNKKYANNRQKMSK